MAVTTKKQFAATTNATTTVFSPVSIQLNNQDDLDVYVTLSGGTRVLQLRQSTGSTAQSSHPQVNNTDGLYFPAVSAGTTLYNYTLSSDNNTITFNSALPSGAVVFCERRTRDADSSYTSFASGSTIRATDLNNSSTESNFTAQDARNKALDLENSIFGGVQPTINGVAQPFIDSSNIIDGSIATADIADSAITSAKLADGTIVTADIANSSITTDKLNNLAVTTAKIADSQITSAKIVDGTIATGDIADNAVTMAKLNSGALPTDVTVASANLVDGTIITADIADSQITSAKIADGTIVAGDLASNAVTTAKILDDNVTADKLAHTSVSAGSYTAADITVDAQGRLTSAASGTIATGEIADSAVTAAKIASNAVTTDKIQDGELTTLAGMQSGTASKLAAGTTLTADIADLNQIDGLTKQTTISDSDASFPTSGAVVDYVAAQLEPFGGFEAIANEVSFPNTQPVSGVAVSIADAAGIVVNGSGTSTTGRTVGGSTVTINGINSQFNSTTVATGIRFIVTSTGSGQVYNYHKATLAESDLVSLSGDINDFAERYRVGSSNPTSSLDNGDLFFNTSTGKLLVYNGTNSAWEEAQSIGNFFISTLSPAFDGTTQDFTLTNAPTNAQQVILSINGVVQKPNAGSSAPSEGFALTGSTVKLSAAPATGSTYHAVVMGSTVNIGTPSNNTVTSAILQNGSVIRAKIADDAVDGSKIADDSITADHIADQAVTLAKLPHGTSSNNGKFLRANNGADPTFESVITDLVNDTSPQLGGQLDTNNFDIKLSDGEKLLLHDHGSLSTKTGATNAVVSGITGHVLQNSTILDGGSMDIWLSTTGKKITFGTSDGATHEVMRVQCSALGASQHGFVNLNYVTANAGGSTSSATKLATTATGVTVTGTVAATAYTGDGSNLTGINTDLVSDTSPQLGGNLDCNGSNIFLDDNNKIHLGNLSGSAGDLQIHHVPADNFSYIDTFHNLAIRKDNGAKTHAKFINNGAVELYHNDSKRFETTSSGVAITGELDIADSEYLDFGNGGLRIRTNSNNAYITEATSGKLAIQGSNIELSNSDADETYIYCTDDGSVDIYHNNEKKFATKSDGFEVRGNAGQNAVIGLVGNNAGDNSDLWRIRNQYASDVLLFQTYQQANWDLGSRLQLKGTSYYGGLQIGSNANGQCLLEAIYGSNYFTFRTQDGSGNTYDKYHIDATYAGVWRNNAASAGGDYSNTTGIRFQPFGSNNGLWITNTFDHGTGGNTPGPYIYNLNGSHSGVRFYVKVDGGVVNHQGNDANLCDERMKTNIVDAPSYYNSIKNIAIKKFNYITEPAGTPLKVGVIAQQVETIESDLVQDEFAVDGNPNDESTTMMKGVREEQLFMMSIKALQEAMAKIEILETKVAALEAA